MNLSHRLYVMHRSRMVAELTGADINEPEVLSHFFREQLPGDAAASLATAQEPMMARANRRRARGDFVFRSVLPRI